MTAPADPTAALAPTRVTWRYRRRHRADRRFQHLWQYHRERLTRLLGLGLTLDDVHTFHQAHAAGFGCVPAEVVGRNFINNELSELGDYLDDRIREAGPLTHQDLDRVRRVYAACHEFFPPDRTRGPSPRRHPRDGGWDAISAALRELGDLHNAEKVYHESAPGAAHISDFGYPRIETYLLYLERGCDPDTAAECVLACLPVAVHDRYTSLDQGWSLQRWEEIIAAVEDLDDATGWAPLALTSWPLPETPDKFAAYFGEVMALNARFGPTLGMRLLLAGIPFTEALHTEVPDPAAHATLAALRHPDRGLDGWPHPTR